MNAVSENKQVWMLSEADLWDLLDQHLERRVEVAQTALRQLRGARRNLEARDVTSAG